MNIKTVENITGKLKDCENEDIINSIIQKTATEKNYTVSYNKSTETLYIDKNNYSLLEDLTTKQLNELENHIVSTYSDENIIYGYIKLNDETQLRIFNKELTTLY